MTCRPHGMMNDDGTCPYCSIFELEQQLTELREEIQAVRNWLDLEHLQRKAGSALLKQGGSDV